MKYFIFLISIVFLNKSYAQKVIIDSKYKPDGIQTVSFTPYFNEEGKPNQYFNSLLEKAISRDFEVCCQSELEYNLLNNETFNDLAVRTIYSDLTQLISTKSNLFDPLTDGEKLEVQNGCNTDLIIITSKIDSRTVSKRNKSVNITVSGNIAVFDLRTGEFIAFISNEIKQKIENKQNISLPLNKLVNSLVNSMSKVLKN